MSLSPLVPCCLLFATASLSRWLCHCVTVCTRASTVSTPASLSPLCHCLTVSPDCLGVSAAAAKKKAEEDAVTAAAAEKVAAEEAAAAAKQTAEEAAAAAKKTADAIAAASDAFNEFDTDGSGVISASDLRNVNSKQGFSEISEENISEMITVADAGAGCAVLSDCLLDCAV